jgi:hypothetical protein
VNLGKLVELNLNLNLVGEFGGGGGWVNLNLVGGGGWLGGELNLVGEFEFS